MIALPRRAALLGSVGLSVMPAIVGTARDETPLARLKACRRGLDAIEAEFCRYPDDLPDEVAEPLLLEADRIMELVALIRPECDLGYGIKAIIAKRWDTDRVTDALIADLMVLGGAA